MDTIKKKMEKAERVGKELVRVLIPEADAYIESFTQAIAKDRQLLFKLQTNLIVPREPHWSKINSNLLIVCNNLIPGCLYSAMQLAEGMDAVTCRQIKSYLESEFFNKLDGFEVGHAISKG